MSPSTDRGQGAARIERRILLALLVPAVLVHAGLVVRTGSGAPLTAVFDGAVALAGIAALVLVFRRPDGPAFLAAVGAGALGVASFLVPGLVAVVQGQVWTAWLDPWAFGALLLDAMIVRIAALALRKVEKPTS